MILALLAGGRGRKISLRSRPVRVVPGQAGLQRETLPQKQNKTKEPGSGGTHF